MKMISLKCLYGVFFTTLLISSSYAQTDLLIGYQGNGDSYRDSLAIVDTTGGILTITETIGLSTNYVGVSDGVNGLYGMAVEPFTGDIYCVYGIDLDRNNRRLGILNPEDGEIEDIDSLGNVTDITFIDHDLYGTTGTDDGYRFVSINKETALYTPIFTHLNANWSNAINFDFFKNYILKSTQTETTWDKIETLNLNETNLTTGAHPGWTTCLEIISDSIMYTGGGSSINRLNTNTFVYESMLSTPSTVHSLAFAELQPALWVNGPRKICGEGTTELVYLGEGDAFVWYMDDEIIVGATDSTYITSISGAYQIEVDGKKSNSVDIRVSNTVPSSFVASSNPAFLDGEDSVNVEFFETVMGEQYSFSWDSGNGEVGTAESVIFTYYTFGTYAVELTVTDTATGCTGVTNLMLTVSGESSITELEVDFDLFPVPAKNVLRVKYIGSAFYNMSLVDVHGAIVSNHILSPINENIFDISELPAGTYFLNITDGVQTTKRKFIKQ